MARVVYSANALANLQRAFSSLEELAPDTAPAAVEAIRTAIEMLEHHPLIGRIVAEDLRELAIADPISRAPRSPRSPRCT